MKTSHRPARRPSWTYRQLTEAAEAQIRWYADFLQALLAKTEDARDRHHAEFQITSWARGAVNLWDRLTEGWKTPGDRERLQALVDAMRVDD